MSLKSNNARNEGEYNSSNLKGLKVHHGINDFSVGEEVILTLADNQILKKDEYGKIIGVNDEDDVLLNIDMIEEEKRKEREKLKKKLKRPLYLGYDDNEFDENDAGVILGAKKSILSHYDKVQSTGPKYIIGNDDTNNNFSSHNSNILNDSMHSDKNKYLQSLHVQTNEISDFYSQSEYSAIFNKPKSGKPKKLRKIKKAEDDDEENDKPVNLDKILTNNSDDMDVETDRGSRRKNELLSNKFTKDEADRKKLFDEAKPAAQEKNSVAMGSSNGLVDSTVSTLSTKVTTIYDRALQQSLERMQRLTAMKKDTSNGGKFNSDSGAAQVIELLEKQKQINIGVNESKMDESESALEIDEIDADGRKKDGKLVFSRTTEFASRLQLLLNDKARESAEEAVRAELKLNKSKDANTAIYEGKDDVEENKENQGGWVHDIDAEESKMDVPDDSSSENEDDDENQEDASKANGVDNQLGFLHRQPLASQSTAAALALLKGSGELKKRDELAGRALDPREKEEVNPNDRIKLEYRDQFGRKLTKKEAFRQLCYRFHGYGPGKQKKDKRLKAINVQRKAGTSLDVQNNVTMKSLTRAQEATGKAHVTISGGSSSATTFSTVAANLIAKLKKKKKDTQKTKKT